MSQKLSEAICRKYGKRSVPKRAPTAAFGVLVFEAYAHVSVASTKHLAAELDRLNKKDCNLTAGLEAVLRIASGARVMLRRNLDTKFGFVNNNGAIGTITYIGTSYVKVKFDHASDEWTK